MNIVYVDAKSNSFWWFLGTTKSVGMILRIRMLCDESHIASSPIHYAHIYVLQATERLLSAIHYCVELFRFDV